MKNLCVLIMTCMIGSVVSGQSDSASFYFEKGVKEEKAQRHREAEKNFAKAVRFDPKSLRYTLHLANSLMEQRPASYRSWGFFHERPHRDLAEA